MLYSTLQCNHKEQTWFQSDFKVRLPKVTCVTWEMMHLGQVNALQEFSSIFHLFLKLKFIKGIFQYTKSRENIKNPRM